MAASRQIAYDFYGCSGQIGDPGSVRAALVAAALAARAEVTDSWVGAQVSAGALAIVLMPQAHLSLHSFPEYGYVAVDFLFADQQLDADACQGYLERFLAPTAVVRRELYRGGEHGGGHYRQ